MNARTFVAALIAGAAVRAMGPSPLAAQEAPDTVRLREIVVTATRLPMLLASTTASVTVITGDELRSRGITTVADALRSMPGADIVETGPPGGATSLFLRGGESNMVRVLLDGVPLNAPGGSYDLANLTTNGVDRIEIVRGPASVLYGSDAVAGVVQVFTRPGRGTPRWEAGARAGSFGSQDYDLRLASGNDAADVSLAASHSATDGIYAFNNRYRNDGFGGSFGVAPDRVTTARVSVRYTDDLYHFPTDPSGNVVHHRQYQAGRETVASLDVGRFFTPRLEGRLLLGGTEGSARVDQEPDGPADTLGFYGFQSYDRLSRRSADLRVNWYAGPAVVTAGAALETERERSWNGSQSQFGPSSGSLTVSRWNRAYYAQAVWDAGAALSLTAGLRLEDNQTFRGNFLFGTFPTYRTGVAYRIGGTKLRAALGTAFKEPSFFENYATGYVIGNPNLKPERSTGWDLGIEQSALGGRLVVGATWFSQRFRDLIQYTATAPVANGPNYYNIAAANASGLELEGRSAPLGPLAITARYTYVRTEAADSGYDGATYAQGRRLLRRPTHSGSLSLTYRLAARGSVSGSALYVGRRDDLDFDPVTFQPTRATLRAYTRLDLSGECALLRSRGAQPGLAATFKVENLLDVRYEQVLHFPSRRRAAFVGLRIGTGP
jgi:vitamin B12 transporter